MDAFAHCAEVMRLYDRDRYVADLFAPEPARRHLFALHAFNAEVARVRDIVSEPMLGEIRLQWWRDVVNGAGVAAGNPVAMALMETVEKFGLPVEPLDRLLEARLFDLYDDPMPSLNDLEGYAGDTTSALIQFAAIALSAGRDPGSAEAAGHAGVALTVTRLLRTLPVHARRGQVYLPGDLMHAHNVDRADLQAGTTTPAVQALLREMRTIARNHATIAATEVARLPDAIKPAFLPLALVDPILDRMERSGYDPFSGGNLPAWRRQWILWRAARRM